MTYEEAIKKIKQFGLYHAIGDLPNSVLTVQAFNMAIEALEKQIPKKPQYEKLPNNDEYWYCPNCGEVILSKIHGFPVINKYNHKHCSGCGRALDWGDE